MNILDKFPDITKISYNLDSYIYQRNKLITYLLKNPNNFANTLYAIKKSGWFGFGSSTVYSPYIDVDNDKFCCLSQTITPTDKLDKPGTCYLSSVKKTYNGFDVNLNNEKFYIKEYQVNDVYIKVFDKAIDLNKYHIYNICNSITIDYSKQIYIGSDKFTNSILIGYILDIIKEKNNINILQTYTGIICNNEKNALLIQEYIDGNSFNKYIKNNTIDSNFIKVVIKQVAENLKSLWEIALFNHGNFTTKSLTISTKSSSKDNFNITIGDFDVSSLSLKTQGNKYARIFHRDTKSDIYYKLLDFKPNVDIEGAYYILNSSFTMIDLLKIQNSGIPFYSSFDFYTFIVSLLANKTIYDIIMKDKNLKNLIFGEIFELSDVSFIYKNIIKLHNNDYDKIDYKVIVNVLNGIRLKCNIFDSVISEL